MASFSDSIQGAFENVNTATLRTRLKSLHDRLSSVETSLGQERKRLDALLHASTQAVQLVSEEQPLRDTLQRLLTMLSELMPGAWGQIRLEPCVARTAAVPELLCPAHPRATTPEPAAWHLPITAAADQRLGRLEVFGPPAREPESWEQDVLDMMSCMAALAIGHARLSHSLVYQAQHDALTELPNRYLLTDRLEQALFLAQRRQTLVAVVLIDLDRFKEINESLGHPVGDRLLRLVADRFRAGTRQTDTLVRMGGDEFLIVLNGLHEASAAVMVARKLLAILGTPFQIGDRHIYLNASAGISLFPQDADDPTKLVQNADSALYRAKAEGHRCPIQCFSAEMTEQALERFELEHQLRGALEEEQLRLYFQPQYHLEKGSVVGVEALVRWDHPQRGLLLPEKFIPLAEQCGLIHELDGWVLREACRQTVAWGRDDFPPLRTWVNVSALSFTSPVFVDTVTEVLEETGLPPSALGLEITESMLMKDLDLAAEHLERLRRQGVHITIDDFGTGYSSLAYLQRLPLDGLKIDRVFMRELSEAPSIAANAGQEPGSDREDGALVAGVVRLAQSLRLQVVAEGVETDQQLDFLRQLGCDAAQGFLLAHPQPSDRLWETVAHGHEGSHFQPEPISNLAAI